MPVDVIYQLKLAHLYIYLLPCNDSLMFLNYHPLIKSKRIICIYKQYKLNFFFKLQEQNYKLNIIFLVLKL